MKILAAQMKHKQRRLFWVNLEQPPTCSKFTQNNLLCLCFICAANIFICGAAFFVPGDVIAYNSMSNILKHRSSKNKTFTSTNKRDYLVWIWSMGGGTSEWPINIILYLKNQSSKNKMFYSTNDWDYFGIVLRWLGGNFMEIFNLCPKESHSGFLLHLDSFQ